MGDLQDPKMEVPIPYIRPIIEALISGNIPRKYGLKYGTVQYLHFRILEISHWPGLHQGFIPDHHSIQHELLVQHLEASSRAV